MRPLFKVNLLVDFRGGDTTAKRYNLAHCTDKTCVAVPVVLDWLRPRLYGSVYLGLRDEGLGLRAKRKGLI